MTVFNSEMHVVTFILIILEALMFMHQYIFYLQKPDKKRKFYLILLFLLIVYNIAGGLFPDESIKLSIVTQNILAYGAGFAMGCFFPYYFYKAFDVRHLKFQATYGVFYFLVLPYLIFFCIVYPLVNNLDVAIYIGLLIPFIYAFYMIYQILEAIKVTYKGRKAVDVILVYLAVCPWALMPLLAYAKVDQLTEVIFTNGGFVIVTVLFFRNMIQESREDYKALLEMKRMARPEPEILLENCKQYMLTPRECEITQLVCEGEKYKDIAEKLFISERTVTKHVQNIFRKTEVTSKIELLNKLGEKAKIKDAAS
jgi:DNA-binding CsgD family transcriptional regulator